MVADEIISCSKTKIMNNSEKTSSNSSLNSSRSGRNGNFNNNRLIYLNNMSERKWDRSRSHPHENIKDLKTDVDSQIETSKRVLQLVNDSGLSMTQINGQRKLGPPPSWIGPAPDPKCEVFVGKLPRNLYESEIYPVFRKIGEIYEIRLMMDFSGTNRGYCFVMYTNAEDAHKAIRELDNYEIRSGRRIGVLASINNCRLCVTHLPAVLNTEAFIRKIYEFTNGVRRVSVYRQADGRPKNSLIYYKTHIDAAMARRRLVPERSTFIKDADITVDWAHPNLSPTNVLEESGVVDEFGRLEMTKEFIEFTRKNSSRDEHLLREKMRSYTEDKGAMFSNKSDSLSKSINRKKTNVRKKPPRFSKNISPENKESSETDENDFDDFSKTRDINGNLRSSTLSQELSKAQGNKFNAHERAVMPPSMNFDRENKENMSNVFNNISYFQNHVAPAPYQVSLINNFSGPSPMIFNTTDYSKDNRRNDFNNSDNSAFDFEKIMESRRGLLIERAVINEPLSQNLTTSSTSMNPCNQQNSQFIMQNPNNYNQVNWAMSQDNFKQNFIVEEPINFVLQNQAINFCQCRQSLPIAHPIEQNSVGEINQIIRNFSNNLRGRYEYDGGKSASLAYHDNQGCRQPRPILKHL